VASDLSPRANGPDLEIQLHLWVVEKARNSCRRCPSRELRHPAPRDKPTGWTAITPTTR